MKPKKLNNFFIPRDSISCHPNCAPMSSIFNRLTRSKQNFNPNEPIPPTSNLLHPNKQNDSSTTNFFTRSKSATSFKKLTRSHSRNKDKRTSSNDSNFNTLRDFDFEPSLESQGSNLQPDILRVYLKQNSNDSFNDSQQFTNYKSLQLLLCK